MNEDKSNLTDNTELINETDLISHFNNAIQEAISSNNSHLDPLNESNTSITSSKPVYSYTELVKPASLIERNPDYLITDKEMKTLEERLEKRLDNLEKCVENLNNENLALKTELSLLKLEVKKKLR